MNPDCVALLLFFAKTHFTPPATYRWYPPQTHDLRQALEIATPRLPMQIRFMCTEALTVLRETPVSLRLTFRPWRGAR